MHNRTSTSFIWRPTACFIIRQITRMRRIGSLSGPCIPNNYYPCSWRHLPMQITGIRNREGNLYRWLPSMTTLTRWCRIFAPLPQAVCAKGLPCFCSNCLPHRGYRFYVPVLSPGPYSIVPAAFCCKHGAYVFIEDGEAQASQTLCLAASLWGGVASLTRCK